MLAGIQNIRACCIAGFTSTTFSCCSDYSTAFLYLKKVGNVLLIHVSGRILQIEFFLLREKEVEAQQYLWFISSSYSEDRLETQASFLASKQTLLYWVTHLVALAVSQPGWIHTVEKGRVWRGNLDTETSVLHSKLSQAQRLDLGVVCITDWRKSFLCQLHLLMAS